MTHLELYLSTLKTLGFQQVSAVNSYWLKAKEYIIKTDDKHIELQFGDGAEPNQRPKYGYTTFGHCFVFSKDGQFLGHGSFE